MVILVLLALLTVHFIVLSLVYDINTPLYVEAAVWVVSLIGVFIIAKIDEWKDKKKAKEKKENESPNA